MCLEQQQQQQADPTAQPAGTTAAQPAGTTAAQPADPTAQSSLDQLLADPSSWRPFPWGTVLRAMFNTIEPGMRKIPMGRLLRRADDEELLCWGRWRADEPMNRRIEIVRRAHGYREAMIWLNLEMIRWLRDNPDRSYYEHGDDAYDTTAFQEPADLFSDLSFELEEASRNSSLDQSGPQSGPPPPNVPIVFGNVDEPSTATESTPITSGGTPTAAGHSSGTRPKERKAKPATAAEEAPAQPRPTPRRRRPPRQRRNPSPRRQQPARP